MKESVESLEIRVEKQRTMRTFPPRELGTEDIPASRYTSEEFFQQERDSVFRGLVWVIAGRESRVPEPGDFFTTQVGLPGSVVVVRNREGALRAFHNVCTHRGLEIATGSGNMDRFRCAYHSWTFDLDGNLTAVVDEAQFHGFDRGCRGLRPVRVERWAGWIWLAIDPDAPPLHAYIGPVADQFEDYGLESYEVIDEDSWVFPVSWKLTIENFIEVYHIPHIHPKTVTPFFDLSAAVMDTYERHSRMTLPFKFADAPLNPDPQQAIPVEISSRLNRMQRNADMHYYIYPNAVFNLVPTYATMFAAYPVGVRETRFDYQILGIGPLDEVTRKYYEPIAAAFREPLREDFAIFESLQRGLDSGAVEDLAINYQEVRIRQMHKVLADDIARGGPTRGRRR